MTTFGRRTFLVSAACSLASKRLRGQDQTRSNATLVIPSEATGPEVPADFVGLSYEVQELVDPSFFSASNAGLVRRFKELSPNGVLRLGGNTSEFEWWKPTPSSAEPEHSKTLEVLGE